MEGFCFLGKKGSIDSVLFEGHGFNENESEHIWNCLLYSKYNICLIKFPVAEQDVEAVTRHLIDICGFCQVIIGCIDGTYVPVKQPCENEKDYFSYKMFYSINC